MIYRIADRHIASIAPFPELASTAAARADWQVVLRPGCEAPSRRRPFHYWDAAHGYRWASFSRRGEALVLHFARTAAFVVEEGARMVTCYPVGRTTFDMLRPVLINQVVPLLLGQERLVLHASAVAAPEGALVFVGPPGCGKSTLASALARRGLPLITDDFLVVDQHEGAPLAVPSGLEPRLWPDSLDAILPGTRRRCPRVAQRTTKRRVSPAASAGLTLAARAAPIAHVFLIDPPAAVDALRPVTPTTAVLRLTASTFVARVDEPQVVQQTFDRIASLVSRARVSRLVPARDFTWLDRFYCKICGVSLARTG